ncbi:MAG: hypothetical protein P1U38_13750 [Aeromicrobium sp.]|uniref:hypothetical protein n=1 Tax=Aeromicrobium sp. TaxID=1871063 RepID=UPI00260D3FDF|nr:hypothetical protein [Aeromicrobium sp.]MDF1705829.1 hypothetical protein [Aeromicrobium sp.]
MSIQVIARGTLLAKPERVEADQIEVAAVMIGTCQEVHHDGRVIALDTVPTAELVCTGKLAGELLQLNEGDVIDVRATMAVSCRLSEVTDRFARGRVSFHAESVHLTS